MYNNYIYIIIFVLQFTFIVSRITISSRKYLFHVFEPSNGLLIKSQA